MNCEYLDWDSTFFNLRIGRVIGNRLTAEKISDVLHWAKTERIECLYFLADSGDPQTIAYAEANGFHLVDIRVAMERPLSPQGSIKPDTSRVSIRPAQADDIPALRAIAGVAHRVGRFYSDPNFPESQCNALYETWIESSCQGYADSVLLAEADSQIAGYVSCHLSQEGEGSIGLLAVDSRFQRRGLGGRLVDAALDYFRRNGMSRAQVVTQASNYTSQRLYQACGFRTRSVQLWYHRHFR